MLMDDDAPPAPRAALPVAAGLDLHHLRVLDALLTHGSLAAAAAVLHRTPSALSHALRELRALLGDPLFVKAGRGLVPTARALGLQEGLRAALAGLDALLAAAAPWDPATARRRFVLASSDSFAVLALPPLLARVRAEAPGVDLELRGEPGEAARTLLPAGEVDLCLDVRPPDREGLRTRLLFEDGFVCLVRAGHPAVGASLDLDTFCALPHVLMSTTGTGQGVVDDALAALGRRRRVALRTRSFLAAPHVVAQSDLLLTAPARFAAAVAPGLGLRILEAPLPLPSFAVRLVWHARSDADPGHRWLREALVTAAGCPAAARG
jgi:DNA-binding transcriptional LysR family regulator